MSELLQLVCGKKHKEDLFKMVFKVISKMALGLKVRGLQAIQKLVGKTKLKLKMQKNVLCTKIEY